MSVGEAGGGSSGNDRSKFEGDSAEIVFSGDEENPEIILKKNDHRASERSVYDLRGNTKKINSYFMK